jgi:CheY-like chemotaxis protein
VLVADDHPVNQKLMGLMLGKLGCTYRVAANGDEAVKILSKQAFDFALLDIEMPGRSGLEVAQWVLESKLSPRPRLIALTAHAIEGFEQVCLEKGMDGYLSKPVSLETLLDALERMGPSSGTLPAPNSPHSNAGGTRTAP